MTVITDGGGAGSVFSLAAAVQVTLAGTVAKGDLIGYSTGWKRADADLGAGPIVPELIALESGVTGGIIKASRMAQVGERYTVNTGTVAGVVLYASGTPGHVTETVPATVGDFRGKVGKILVAGTATVKPVVVLSVPVFMPVHRFYVTAAVDKAAAFTENRHVFTAVRPCIVRAISYMPRVLDGAATTLDVQKIVGVQAPAGGTTMLTAEIDLNGTADTTVVGALAAIAARTLAAGNGIAIDHSAGATGAVGVVTIELEYIE